LLFILIGAAIDAGISYIFSSDNGTSNYRKELLQYIQKIVELVLKESRKATGNISANMMIREGGALTLIEFDIKTVYRKSIQLPIDPACILPGAPEACIKKKITYVHNTQAKDVIQFFSKDVYYKSFFSIPIMDSNQEVWAVINIDSTEKDQFVNLSYINDTIFKAITPIISLINLEHRFHINGHKQKDELEGVYDGS
jgi:hypothetical protein